jgi:hypothetical protein
MAQQLNICYDGEMLSSEDWFAAVEEVAAELLSRAEIVRPPVDVVIVAQRLGLEVAWDASQTTRGRLQRVSGRPAMFLRPDTRHERIQWAAAHELGEQFSICVLDRLGLTAEELLPRQREEIANQLANRLLVPTDWFAAAWRDCQGDLLAVKSTFSTASCELLGWRRLDQVGDRVVTILDHGEIARRRCNFATRTPLPQQREIAAWTACHATGLPQSETWPGGTVRVWPVHEPDWKRDIAITEFDPTSQSE